MYICIHYVHIEYQNSIGHHQLVEPEDSYEFHTDLLWICMGMNEHIFHLYIILHLHFFQNFYESSLWQSFAGQSLQAADDLKCHLVFISIELISSYAVYANSLNLLTK